MARPIEPTPHLTGEEAEELAASLEVVASPEEIKRRKEEARRWLSLVTTPFEERHPKDEPK
jgi:uncharacterized protein (DUF2384 family)